MEEEHSATCRYYCHMCSLIVRPELGIEELKCPHCHSGFVEEMLADVHADGRRGSNAVVDRAATEAGADADAASGRASPWAPILMDLLGGSSGLDGGDLAALARIQYRHLAFLQLLNALQEGDADGDEPDAGLERLLLVSPTDAHAMLRQERGDGNGAAVAAGAGMTFGELILGTGLDLLLEYLAETDASRQGTPPAKKEAVAAMPTVQAGARGRDLPGVPGRVRDRRRGEGDAVQAQVPRRVHRTVAGREQLLPRVQVPAAHGRVDGARGEWRRGKWRRVQWQCERRRRR